MRIFRHKLIQSDDCTSDVHAVADAVRTRGGRDRVDAARTIIRLAELAEFAEFAKCPTARTHTPTCLFLPLTLSPSPSDPERLGRSSTVAKSKRWTHGMRKESGHGHVDNGPDGQNAQAALLC